MTEAAISRSPALCAARPALARLLALILAGACSAARSARNIWAALHPCEMCYWQRWPHGARDHAGAALRCSPPSQRARTHADACSPRSRSPFPARSASYHAGRRTRDGGRASTPLHRRRRDAASADIS